MKRITAVMMIALITSCGGKSRDDLFHDHIRTLVDGTYQVNDTIPFEVTGRYTFIDNKYQMELIFDRAKENLNDITILLIDDRQVDYKESPFNLGYFNDAKMNLAAEDENNTTRKAYRFNWYGASYNITMKIVFTHVRDEVREELFFNYSDFKLYNEVSYGNK